MLRYRESRKSRLNVCVEGIKSGSDPTDTWVKSLQEIHMVTGPVAKAIVDEYPTIKCLYEGYRQCATIQDAEAMLEDIPVRRVMRMSVDEVGFFIGMIFSDSTFLACLFVVDPGSPVCSGQVPIAQDL